MTGENKMIIDDKLWHICFAAGEDGRYNELVEADCPMAAVAMVKKRNRDWREDAPFTISAVRILLGRVVESDPIDLQDYRKGTKFKFHGVRQYNHETAKRFCDYCEARR
jgi:hypothetical protein